MEMTRKLKLTRKLGSFVVMLGTGALVFQGCPMSGTVGRLAGELLSECYGENTISAEEFDDLSFFERTVYEPNDCGRYEPVSSLLNDLL